MEEDLAQKRTVRLTVPMSCITARASGRRNRCIPTSKARPKYFTDTSPRFDYGLTDLGSLPDEVIVQAIEGTILANALLALKYGRDWEFLKNHFNETFILVVTVLQTSERRYFRCIFAAYPT